MSLESIHLNHLDTLWIKLGCVLLAARVASALRPSSTLDSRVGGFGLHWVRRRTDCIGGNPVWDF